MENEGKVEDAGAREGEMTHGHTDYEKAAERVFREERGNDTYYPTADMRNALIRIIDSLRQANEALALARDRLREDVAYEIKNAHWEAEQNQKAQDDLAQLRRTDEHREKRWKEAESHVRRLTDALKLSHDALDEMADWHGSTHESECPQDDTCNCAYRKFNDRVNEACRVGEQALAPADGKVEK